MTAKLDNTAWKGKLSAGVLAGAGLAFGFMAVTGLLCHTTGSPMTLSAQFLLWVVAFVWVVVVSSCFLFSSGWKAWGWLGGACLLIWLVFLILKNVIR